LAEELVESEQRDEVFSSIIASSIDNLLEIGMFHNSVVEKKKK
jgi:hypothetical protein